jgi:hypothetical protein
MAKEAFEAKPAAPAAPRAVIAEWGQLVPADFGLKAGYCPTSDGGEVQFIPIVAWFTGTTRTVEAPLEGQNFLVPVVVAPNGGLTPAMQVAGMRFLENFPKDMPSAGAWALSAQWRRKARGGQATTAGPGFSPSLSTLRTHRKHDDVDRNGD